jgi:hypothetical protein
MSVVCTWCGNEVEAGEGYRLAGDTGDRVAAFCRLEHAVPWAMQGARWDAGKPVEPPGTHTVIECSECGAPLSEGHLLLVRHRGGHRVPDGFCSVGHLLAWAKAGGRWRT